MTQKELFKGKVVELFNTLLPNNTIDDYSLEIVETKEHTTLFDLLNCLEESENPPICTRETDDAVHVIYTNITFIFPYDFKRIKLFYNSDVKIYIKRPEYVELQQLADFICGLDSEMNHWKRMWRYYHDLDVLKLKSRLKEGEKCRRLIEKIEYPFREARIDAQRLEYYNIMASRLFLDNEMFDYVYQRSLDMIVERCRVHGIYPDVSVWKKEFDDVLNEKRLMFLIAEEMREANRRKNEKIRHLLSLGFARLQAALAGVDWHSQLQVFLRPVSIDMESRHNVLQDMYYHLEINLFGTASTSLDVPYARLGEVTGPLVESFRSMNALMPKLDEDIRGYDGKFEVRSYYFGRNNRCGDPFHLDTVDHRPVNLLLPDIDHGDKAPYNENLEIFNDIFNWIKKKVE